MTRRNVSRTGFLILLALTDRPRHGLAIVEEIDARTDGAEQIGPASLYSTLKRLLALGFVAEPDQPPDPSDDDPRRRYYEITPEGRRALRDDAVGLQRLLQVAEGKSVL